MHGLKFIYSVNTFTEHVKNKFEKVAGSAVMVMLKASEGGAVDCL